MHSIYIHIPFCLSRCRYCDFFSTTQLDQRKAYVDALLREWQQRQVEDIATIYFGGGTPSLLDTDDLARLLAAFPFSPSTEITLEANPGDLSLDKLRALRQLGINRLSIGVQSFHNTLLRTLGRRHTARQARQAVRWAQQAGFTNISIDLMYGLPRQNMLRWSSDVRRAVRLGVQHISCYCLSYEQGTPFDRMRQQGLIHPASERLQNRMYHLLCRVLQRNGFTHYEVSNFALPDYHSRHNSNYWNFTPYIGLGAGAHSFDGNTRSWNPSNLKEYIDGITAGNLQREQETLTSEQRQIETVMLALRTSQGLNMALLPENKQQVAQQYIQQGLLRLHHNQLIATPKGINILNRIIEDLI